MKVYKSLSFFLFYFCLHALPAQGRWADCSIEKFSGIPVQYCIFSADRVKNPKVIFHLHGLGGDEKIWGSHYGASLDSIWLTEGKALPTVVTFSFGKAWMLSEVASQGNRYRLFIDQIMPFLENKIGSVDIQDRILVGESMGGLNGSQILAKDTGLFSKYALLCPAFTNIGPQSTEEEVDDYIRRTGATWGIVKSLIVWAKMEFPTKKEWDEHEPFALLAKAKGPFPPIFLSIGDQDNFGFLEGTLRYNQQLMDQGANPIYKSIPLGLHCTLDVGALSKFLSSDWKNP